MTAAPLAKWKIALATLALFPLALELGLRVFRFALPPARPPIVIWNREEDKRLGEDDESLHISTARQLWTPRPGAEVAWGSAADERINARGYRGPELAIEKTPGVLRLATFGDSSTFGMGVPFESTYGAQTVARLRDRGVPAEVLDAGVIGFTVEQGIERYLALVRPYRPDVVTLAFGAINDELPTPDLEDREKIAHSAIELEGWPAAREWIRGNLRVVHFGAWIVEKLQGVDRDQMVADFMAMRAEQRERERTHGRADWPGKRRVSLARFEESLARFVELVRQDGAAAVLISMPRHAEEEERWPVLLEYNAIVARVGERTGAPVFDARQTILGELARGAKWDDLFVDHFHPSKRGHAIFADGLAPIVAAAATK